MIIDKGTRKELADEIRTLEDDAAKKLCNKLVELLEQVERHAQRDTDVLTAELANIYADLGGEVEPSAAFQVLCGDLNRRVEAVKAAGAGPEKSQGEGDDVHIQA